MELILSPNLVFFPSDDAVMEDLLYARHGARFENRSLIAPKPLEANEKTVHNMKPKSEAIMPRTEAYTRAHSKLATSGGLGHGGWHVAF